MPRKGCSSVGVAKNSAWVNPSRSSEREGAEPDAVWQEVCHETKLQGKSNTTDACIEAMWKSFGKLVLVAAISLQKR